MSELQLLLSALIKSNRGSSFSANTLWLLREQKWIFWAQVLNWEVQKLRKERWQLEGRKGDFMRRSVESWRKQRFHEALRDGDQGLTFFSGISQDFPILSKLGLTRSRHWRESKSRESLLSFPFWFLFKEKTSYLRDREFLWEVFEKFSFKVMTAVSVFIVQQDPKLLYGHGN